MRIFCVISTNPFFEKSASANRLLTLIEGLADLGADVRLVITGGYMTPEEFKKFGRKGQIGKIKFQYLTFLFGHNIWLRRLNKYILQPILKTFVNWRVLGIARKNPNAIFWTASDLESFELVLKLKKQNPGLRTFLEMSEFLDIQQYNKGLAIHRLEGGKRQKLFEEKAYFAYDGLALMTKTLMKHYEQFPQPCPKLLHLPMTVDLDRFDKPLHPVAGFVKPYIAFVGVMNNAKEGVNLLIEAFEEIANEFPTHKLYLVGPWHYDTPSHTKSIRELGLAERIILMGEFNRDTIPAIIKNAALLVLPRPDSKQAQGGFPTKLGEYLATGNPVCATMVGEIPDYLVDGQSVFFAEPGSVESFADAMHRALSNYDAAKRIGASGRKSAETHFSKDIQARMLFRFLNDTFPAIENN